MLLLWVQLNACVPVTQCAKHEQFPPIFLLVLCRRCVAVNGVHVYSINGALLRCVSHTIHVNDSMRCAIGKAIDILFLVSVCEIVQLHHSRVQQTNDSPLTTRRFVHHTATTTYPSSSVSSHQRAKASNEDISVAENYPKIIYWTFGWKLIRVDIYQQ